jgi:hypothetical protein
MGKWTEKNMSSEIGMVESWNILQEKIDKNIPFCYVRFNEGESRMVANIPGTLRSGKWNKDQMKLRGKCEIVKYGPNHDRKWGRWSYDQEKDKNLHEMMMNALCEEDENYFASCCCIGRYSNYRYQILLLMEERMKNLPKRVLSAHMPHCKPVYDKVYEYCKKFQPKINLVVNEEGNIENLPFKINNCWRVSNEEAMKKNMNLIDIISEEIEKKDIKNELFFGSAGPFTNILFHQLWKRNPTNFYIDIGSLFDLSLFNQATRNWLTKMDGPERKRGPHLR